MVVPEAERDNKYFCGFKVLWGGNQKGTDGTEQSKQEVQTWIIQTSGILVPE